MSKLPAPRRAEIDGTEMVMLEPLAYEQLRAYRRQAGAQAVRLREQRHRLEKLTARLDDIARLAQALPACPGCPEAGCPASAGCARKLLLAALADGRRAAGGGQPGRLLGPGQLGADHGVPA